MATKKFRSKKEIVYDGLREDIVKGIYKPGERLVIDELARQMGASQIPIREAIQQLEADGFVTIEPHVGARIAEIDASFIFEVFALLESMEIISSRRACVLMTDEQLDTLSAMVVAMDELVDDPISWSAQNKAMHLYIGECANTLLVLKMMTKVFDHWERLRLNYLHDLAGNRIPEAQKEHHQLLAAMKSRNPDAVETTLKAHIQSAISSYKHHLEEQGHLVEIGSN